MTKKHGMVLGAAAGVLLLVLTVITHTTKKTTSEDQPSAYEIDEAKSSVETPQRVSDPMAKVVQQSPVKNETSSDSSDDNETDDPIETRRYSTQTPAEWIIEANFYSGKSLRYSLAKLKQFDRGEVARTILNGFERGRMSPLDREKAIWFGSQLNSVEFVPLWVGLLYREYPASSIEVDFQTPTMPTGRAEWLAVLQSEQLTAVKMLGALQLQNQESKTTLDQVVYGSKLPPFSHVSLRSAAVRARKSKDPLYYARLAGGLKAEDPLRDELRQILQAKRSQP